MARRVEVVVEGVPGLASEQEVWCCLLQGGLEASFHWGRLEGHYLTPCDNVR